MTPSTCLLLGWVVCIVVCCRNGLLLIRCTVLLLWFAVHWTRALGLRLYTFGCHVALMFLLLASALSQVLSVDTYGVLVSLGKNIRGLVTQYHIADVLLKSKKVRLPLTPSLPSLPSFPLTFAFRQPADGCSRGSFGGAV